MQDHSDNSSLKILGFYSISVNLESQTATNSFVIATLYDKDGKVISTRTCTSRTGNYYSALSGALRNRSEKKLETCKSKDYSLAADSDPHVEVLEDILSTAALVLCLSDQ